MGQAKKMLMELEEMGRVNDDIFDFFSELNRREALHGAIAGITAQMLDKGIDTLSEKQREALESYAEDFKYKHPCYPCEHDNTSRLMDYIEIMDDGMCPSCRASFERFQEN